MSNHTDGDDKPGPARYSAVYWVAVVAAFALLIVDIFDDSAIWNYAVVACIVVAIAVRPGGLRGRRAAAPADDAVASDDGGSADEPAARAT